MCLRQKRNLSSLLGFLLVLVSPIFCQSTPEQELSKAANCFTYRLYQQLAKDQSSLISSPFSLDILLSILRTGAEGITYKELTEELGYENLSDSDMENAFQTKLNQFNNADSNTLKVANSVWVQKDFTINPSFVDVVTKKFNSEVETVDFLHQADSATDEINEWGNSKTQGLIPKLFDDPLDPNTVMVLVNAIYFKGTWDLKFDKDFTRPGPFNNDDSSDHMTTVQFMHQQTQLNYHEDHVLNAQVLELFYTGLTKSMVIILPKDGSTLAQMEESLNCDSFSNAIRPGYSTLVDVKMPKFDLNSVFDLQSPLENLGINDIFTPSANLSRIAKHIFVNKAIQKAIIQVYEEGTKAAVITGVGGVQVTSIDEPKIVYFDANHPFLFLIRDIPTNLILFMGRVNNLPNFIYTI